MKDALHAALKWIDYNRYTFLSLLLLVAVIIGSMAGCQPRALFSGQQLTAEEIQEQAAAEQEAIAAEVAAKKAELAAQIAEAVKMQNDAAAIVTAAEAAGQQLDEATRAKLDALQTRIDKALDVIDAKYAQIETLLNMGIDTATTAAAGTPAAGIVPTIGLALATLLLGRRDKSRADKRIAELKAGGDSSP